MVLELKWKIQLQNYALVVKSSGQKLLFALNAWGNILQFWIWSVIYVLVDGTNGLSNFNRLYCA